MPTGIQSARRSTSSLPVGPANANNDLWSASCASGGSDRRMRHAECHRARLEPKHRVGNPESRNFVLLLGARRPMSQAAGMTTGGIEGRGVETGRFRCDDGRGRGQMRRIREVQRMPRLGLSRADRPAVRSHMRQVGCLCTQETLVNSIPPPLGRIQFSNRSDTRSGAATSCRRSGPSCQGDGEPISGAEQRTLQPGAGET